MLELADVINQEYLLDIYRAFCQNTKEYIFSAPHGTFSKTGHILKHKASFNRYKKTEITPCILSEHHGLNLDISNNRTESLQTHGN